MKTKEQRVLLLWSTWTCMLFDLSHSEEKPNELKVRPANLGSCRQSGGLPEVLKLNILMFTLLACHFLCQNDVLGLTAGHFMPEHGHGNVQTRGRRDNRKTREGTHKN